MLRLSKKILFALLMTVSVVTFINVLVMYWFPIIIPISSFTAVRLVFLTFIVKKYWLLIFSFLICLLLFLTAVSVYRRHILLPTLSLIYLIYDFVIVLSLFINGLGDGHWKTYIIQMTVSIALIALLGIYCFTCLRNYLHNHN